MDVVAGGKHVVLHINIGKVEGYVSKTNCHWTASAFQNQHTQRQNYLKYIFTWNNQRVHP